MVNVLRGRPGRARAFTLVELLVVIGIIAALIGILLPVLSGVQARGRDIKCQSNIRQMLVALQGYIAEYKGSLPYGLVYEYSHPVTWERVGDSRFFSWPSLLGKFMKSGSAGDNAKSSFGEVFQCPEAKLQYNHIVGYVANMVAFPAPIYEYPYTPASIPLWRSPPKVSGVFPHNILIWDTAVDAGLDNSVGYLVGADLDDVQRFWQPDYPQYRFYDPADPYSRLMGGARGNNRPVAFNSTWKNIDPHEQAYPYQGNLRFRHNKQTAVHCGFMDGHVEGVLGKFNGNGTMRSHDALRKNFMIKWPPGMPRNPSVP